MTSKTIAILGAGSRGSLFGHMIDNFSHLGRVVAVAEPRDAYRTAFAERHQVPSSNSFANWQEFVARPKMADAVIISTMDRDHAAPALACLQKGYDVLVEKPTGTTLAECRAVEQAQRQSNRIVGVCHSLRYHKAFRRVKDMLAAGAVGRIMNVDLLEQVVYWHQVHSFVRGNWANESRSTFMLMSKSCHDIDYLCYLIDEPCLRVSSFGSLSYFRRENAPAGSTDRCTDPCPIEATCPYSAITNYVDTQRDVWPADTICPDHSREAHMQAIRTGPYGRCAWKCDNDVVDHQVVAMQFDRDIAATFSMTAFTQGPGRRLRVHGTHGELAFDESTIILKSFGDGNVQRLDIGAETGEHGGGDARVLREWLTALHTRDTSNVVADAQEALRSHTICFAAEISRRENRTVAINEL